MSNTNVFVEFINELREVEEQIAELEATKEAIRTMIKEELDAAGLDELMVGTTKLTYRTTISNRFDTTGFKKLHSDLYKQYVKTTEYKRLTING